MKFFLLFIAVVSAYTDIEQGINFEVLLKDNTKLREFFDCLIDKVPCTEQTQHIRDHIEDIVMTDCGDCDKLLRYYSHTVLMALKKKIPNLYHQYQAKYDPDGKYLHKFEKPLTKPF